jgi:hypothetical protein
MGLDRFTILDSTGGAMHDIDDVVNAMTGETVERLPRARAALVTIRLIKRQELVCEADGVVPGFVVFFFCFFF